ncbi:MAG: DUF6316 family protein [Thiohalophilus sp.]
MHIHRTGEDGSIPFRSGRFFNIDANWYFSCREGQDIGPYPSRAEAEAALSLYIRKIKTQDQRIYN